MPRDFRPGRLAVAVMVGAAFLAGLSADHVAQAARRDASQPYRSLDVFAEVLGAVLNNYVEDVKVDRVMEGAMRGLADGLDPDSAYLSADEVKLIEKGDKGPAAETGIELTRNFYLRVIAVRDPVSYTHLTLPTILLV